MSSTKKNFKPKQGDIFWVDWKAIQDLDNQEKIKPRPALVISNDACHKLDRDIIVCPITTTPRLNQGSFVIPKNNRFLDRSLPADCEIRCDKIATIPISDLANKHGEIADQNILKEIIEKVHSFIS